MTLDERKKYALDLHRQGYNCAQCTAMAFSDLLNTDTGQIAKIAIGFGGGFGGQAEVCGVISGMTLVCGAISEGLPENKKEIYSTVKYLSDEFKSVNHSIICRELKSMNPPCPCSELILRGIEILHHKISDNDK